MQIHIQIHVRESGGGILLFTNPHVKRKYFKVDPDREAAKWAYARIYEASMEMGGRYLEIEKVFYNGDRNITELVKEMEETFDLFEWKQKGYIK
ncbi:hypothetical protein [Heyndrickxia camelliae]|uniref:Uncharacterized protein n=1 Tax=Heyndrickxia camelliae TaxID=1707093 RepID=A0A2N3LNA4_9BACI|nr:hypothetical protein [Heyndrickxia camelliae]PKR86088.1 hypothetical protein CWO92_06870 [Heyndrickxia camelliae]